MKKYFLLMVMAVSVALSTSGSTGNNYDDIDNFFEEVSGCTSPNINYFYISKAMLKLSANSALDIGVGKFEKITDKIDFIRNAEITAGTPTETSLVDFANDIAQRRAETFGYKKLFVRDIGNGQRNFLFVKNGEGGLCSVLIINMHRGVQPNGESSIQRVRVLLIGGTFHVQEILSLI